MSDLLNQDFLNRTILQGDVLEKLKEIPNESINCIISSPPYWGLRDYGVEGQLGLEPDFRDYLKTMSKIMDELKRVLRSDGTCWINLGDTYAGGGGHAVPQTIQASNRKNNIAEYYEQDFPGKAKYRGTMGKSRFGIPERFYINCIDNGWLARNHIPWYKANAMPSSVKDRFTNKWESIFFLVKNQKYYFDLDSVREPTITETKPFNVRVRDSDKPKFLQQATLAEIESHNKKGERKELNVPGQTPHGIHRRRQEGLSDWEGYGNKQDSTLGADGKPKATYTGFNERWKRKWEEDMGQTTQSIAKNHNGNYDKDTGESLNHPKGKNPGDVFFINPRPFSEAHFATFPVDLPERIIRCGCPQDGIVLDPFFGSGTVGVAAEKLGRKWIGIELNEEYIKIARKRLDPYMTNKMGDFF